MALQSGTRVGPYEVTGQIGAGGMGEVYRAVDTNLGRHVAIKVLPDTFANDPERLARFEREAKTLASLNHPNIAQIYGLEKMDHSASSGPAGVRALVMELVEGPTLADRIAQGRVPVDEALPIAKQIAEALEAAHEQGIIHRDLKPANIKLRPDGTVKVLDFGLAKLISPPEGGQYVQNGRSVRLQPDPTASPTITSPAMMTGVGVLLGTAAYMSPEQARGKAVDKRADIWAFGCVLFEMLTGRRAFDGEDVAAVLARIIEREPEWNTLPQSVPQRVRELLRLCLEKNPKHRRQAAADVRIDVDRVLLEPAGPVWPGARDPAHVWRRVALASVASAIGAAIVGAGAMGLATRPAPPSVVRTEVTTSGAAALSMTGVDRDLAITPDGSRIVYRGVGQLLVRALDRLEPTPLTGLVAPRGPFISPDGQWVGFFDGSFLKKVAITGGPPVTVASVNGIPRGATWGEDGTIVFATNTLETGLQRVSAAGGEVTVLTTPDREHGEFDHQWPEFLPGGHSVLFTIISPTGSVTNAQIAVLDLRTGTQTVLVRGGHHAHYVPTGHVVYGAGSTLRAVAFDLARLAVVGTPIPVVENMATTVFGSIDAMVAANGTLAYLAGGVVAEPRRSLVWVDRSGREEPLKAPERAYAYPRMSPDGTRVAISIRDQQQDIWVWDFARDTLTRMTFDPAVDHYPVWTPDGRRLLFGRGIQGSGELFWQAADGTGSAERLSDGSPARPADQQPYSISPDGSRVVLRQGVSPFDLSVMLLGRERRTEPLTQTPFNEGNAEISPDGRWLAYESNESGQREIYVRPFPDVSGGRWQLSTGGGTRPLWARSGQELFYMAVAGDDVALMLVQIQRGTSWRASAPTKLFVGRFFFSDVSGSIGEARTYDISPDGRRFLMIKESRSATESSASTKLIVVQHWLEELKRLVPTN